MMNNHASRTLLKVDATTLNVDSNYAVIIYNINIPQNYLTDQQELSSVLTRIEQLLSRDFANLSVLYQISASYILKNSKSGETKTWTGSFFARNNVLGVIAQFQQFVAATFVRNSLSQLINIEQKLLANGLNTEWKFDQLLSIIYNIQSKVPQQHRLAQNGPNRNHRTFPL